MVLNGRFLFSLIVPDHKIVADKQKASMSPRLSAEVPPKKSPRLSAEVPPKTLSPKSGSTLNPPPSLGTPSSGGAHQGLDQPGDVSSTGSDYRPPGLVRKSPLNSES